tara:strand:+ start:570 stop:890 length:321 start_codon:yes stop_codon:yes gene_type:complete
MLNIRGPRIGKGIANGYLYVAIFVMPFLLLRLAIGDLDAPRNPEKVWISTTFEFFLVYGVIIAMAIGCYFAVPKDEGDELKWGARMCATGLPLGGVALLIWAKFFS